MKVCSVDGCDKPTRSSGSSLCPKHYHRWYRHGDVNVVAVPGQAPSVFQGRRYRTVSAPGHPIASKAGRAYEHRVVLYDLIGPGPHACHWCGESVDWLPKGTPGELQVDHLNNIGDDNRPENLVASCRRCNTARGSQRRHDVLVENGWWSHHDTIAALAKGRGRRVA